MLLVTGLLLIGAKLNAADSKVLSIIRKEAIKQDLDPNLAIAVATAESGLNQQARGRHGEIGLFQIMPYNAGGMNIFEVHYNVQRGIYLIKRAKQACSDMGPFYIICYNQGAKRRPKYPYLHPYYKAVREYYLLASGWL